MSKKWIFTIPHHTRHRQISFVLRQLAKTSRSTKCEYFEAPYLDSTKIQSINWYKMEGEELMENTSDSTCKNNNSHAAFDLQYPKTTSQKQEKYTKGRFFYICNASYLHRLLSQAGFWARRMFNQIQYPHSFVVDVVVFFQNSIFPKWNILP